MVSGLPVRLLSRRAAGLRVTGWRRSAAERHDVGRIGNVSSFELSLSSVRAPAVLVAVSCLVIPGLQVSAHAPRTLAHHGRTPDVMA
jgi:hypothetical protein